MTLDQYLKKQLKDPEFKKEWEALAPQRELKRRVIKLRTKKDMTQKQLAMAAGMHQASIARFERGDYSPTISFLSRLASAMGMKLKIDFA